MLVSKMTINGQVGEVNSYSNNEVMAQKSADLFEIVKQYRPKKIENPYQGHQPSELVLSAIGEQFYTQKELTAKGNRLNKALTDGFIYYLDLEGVGQPTDMLKLKAKNQPGVSKADINELLKANEQFQTVTEIFLMKQEYKNGKPVGEPQKAFSQTATRNAEDYIQFISTIEKTKGAGDFEYVLGRFAGAAHEGAYKNGEAYSWNANANVLDGDVIRQGINNHVKNSKYKVGTKEYNQHMGELYDIFKQIAESDNMVLETLNGDNYDIPMILDALGKAGFKMDEELLGNFLDSHADVQRMMSQVMKGEVFNDIGKARQLVTDKIATLYSEGTEDSVAKAKLLESELQKMDFNITNQGMTYGAYGRGAEEVKIGTLHNAEVDVKTMAKNMEYYHEPLVGAIDKLNNAPVGDYDSTIYTAKRAIILDKDKDLFFSSSYGDNANTYNPVAMEAGHSYKLSMYEMSAEDFKLPSGLLDEDARRYTNLMSNLDGKVLLEMEDMHEYFDGVKRKSYMILNSQEEIQEKLLDTGNIETRKMSSLTPNDIKVTTEKALSDKARRDKEAWFAINSDKGYKSFETYLSIMEDYKNKFGDEATKANFEKVMREGKDMSKIMPSLYTRGEANSLIHERVTTFHQMYDDLDKNFDMYKFMQGQVESVVGSPMAFKNKYGIADDIDSYAFKNQYTKAQTSALKRVRQNIYDTIYDNLSDDDLRLAVLNNSKTPIANAKWDNILRANASNGIKIAPLLEEHFEEVFGFKFDRNSEEVRNAVIGYAPLEETSRDMGFMDIINVDGEYSRVRIGRKEHFQRDLDNKLIHQVKGSDSVPKEIARNNYMNNVSADLYRRGLIDSEQYSIITSSYNPFAKSQMLGEMVRENSSYVEDLVKSVASDNTATAAEILATGAFDYSGLNKEEAEYVKNYIKNIHMKPIMSKDPVDSIAGRSLSTIFGQMKDEHPTIFDNINDDITDSISKIFTYSTPNSEQSNKIAKMLKKEYGYTDSNVKLFMDAVINNEANKNFTYASGKEVKGGVFNAIRTIGDDDYLITATKDKFYRIEDYLLNNKGNVDIDELKTMGIVYKMDKVTELEDGLRVIKRSDASAMAITKQIKAKIKAEEDANGISKDIVVSSMNDTIDTVMIGMKSKYNRALDAMAMGNYAKANAIMNSAKRPIHEGKALSGIVVSNGTKTIRSTIADQELSNMVNISDLLLSADTILKNETLAVSYKEFTSKDKDSLIDAVKQYSKNRYANDNGLFAAQDTKTKLWFAMNSREIATELLNDELYMSRNKGSKEILEAMQTYGTSLFLTKDSGDAAKGWITMSPITDLVAGSIYSGISRPLLNQVLNSKPINEADMLQAALKYNNDSMKNISELEKKYNIKMSRSFITEKAVQKELTAAKQGNHMAFSTTVKYMNEEQFRNKVNSIVNMQDAETSKWAESLMQKHGVTKAQIQEAAEAIGGVTSLHEDSGAINPMFARLFEEKTVMVAKDVKNVEDYVVGGTYKGKEIIGIQGNNITYKNNSDYFDIKLIFGGSEKGEYHSPQIKDKSLLGLYSDVFDKISGGANIILNPNIEKHEAFNSMITTYTNAITNNISNEKDAAYANSIFKKHFTDTDGNWLHKYQIKKVNGRYALVEGQRVAKASDIKFEALEAFNNVVEDFKSSKSSYGLRVKNDIKKFEHDGIGWGDFATAMDNTIEKVFEMEGDKRIGGAKINHRSQQVLGLFIGNDPMSEITKYRKMHNGEVINPLKALVDSDIDQMLSDKKFIERMQESSNVGAALAFSSKRNGVIKDTGLNQELLDKAVVKTMSINDIHGGGGTMTPYEISDIFKFDISKENYNKKTLEIAEGTLENLSGQRVNVYKVDLEGLRIANPEYEDLIHNADNYKWLVWNGKFDAESFAVEHGIQKTVGEIYIPALHANRIGDDKYTLTETQKAAASLINEIKALKDGDYGNKTRNTIVENINKYYAEYTNRLRHDLTHKEGLYKRSLNIRSEKSARLKLSNIEAPILDSAGQYKNKLFKDTATKMVDGKVKYRGVQYLNAESVFGSLENAKKSYRNVGEQLLTENIGNAEEVTSFLQKHFGDKNASLKQLRAKGNNLLKDDKALEALGEKYFKTVGFDALLMRDPAMLTTSYQPVRTLIHDGVVTGSVWLDAVTAKLVNGDGDGDEVNTFFHLLSGKYGDGKGFKLKKNNSMEHIALEIATDIYSDAKTDILNGLASDLINKIKDSENNEMYILKNYKELIKNTRGANVNYLEDGIEAAILARLLKGEIGQVSNTNYFLRAAATQYTGSRGASAEMTKMQRNIQLFTDITEQSLIDAKSVKDIPSAIKLADIASSYRKDVDTLARDSATYGNYGAKVKSTVNLIKNVGETLSDKGGKVNGVNMVNFDSNILKDDTLLTEMAERIVKGTYNRGYNGNSDSTTVEEILGDIHTILQDAEANAVYYDPTVRQGDTMSVKGNLLPEFMRNDRAVSAVGLRDSGAARAKIFEKSGAKRFLLNAPEIEDKILTAGDTIVNKNIDSLLDTGMYRVEEIFRKKNGDAAIKLLDVSSGMENKKYIYRSGETFADISRELVGFEALERGRLNDAGYIKEMLDSTIQSASEQYEQSALTSIEGLENLFREKTNSTKADARAATRARANINYDSAKDMLATVEILRENKMATEDEISAFISNMNASVRSKDKAVYRKMKKEQMLNIKTLVSERKITSGNYEQFTSQFFNEEAINKARDGAIFKSGVEKAKELQRYNIDEISAIINKTADNIITGNSALSEAKGDIVKDYVKGFKIDDEHNFKTLQDIYAKYAKKREFQKQALNMNLGEAMQLLKDPASKQKAYDMLGETIISYGEFAGFKLSQLGDDKMAQILSSDYLKGVNESFDRSVIQETKNIIKKMSEISENNDIIIKEASTLAHEQITERYGDSLTAQMSAEMNRNIKERGKKAGKKKFDGFNLGSVGTKLDELKTGFNNLSGKKKALYAGAGLAAAGLALAALGSSGKKTLAEQDNKYESDGSYRKETVKNAEIDNSDKSYKEVPMSDRRFYQNQDTGLAVKVRGKSNNKTNERSFDDMFSGILGGIDINSSYNDSRSQINDSDIDRVMSESLRY